MTLLRSCHGMPPHSGKNASAAAMASLASCAVARANRPITTSASIGDRSSSNPSPCLASPLTWNGCSWPSHDRAVSSPASNAACSSSLSADSVA